MAAATSRRKQAASMAACSTPTTAAKRVLAAPGCGALHMIPSAAVLIGLLVGLAGRAAYIALRRTASATA